MHISVLGISVKRKLLVLAVLIWPWLHFVYHLRLHSKAVACSSLMVTTKKVSIAACALCSDSFDSGSNLDYARRVEVAGIYRVTVSMKSNHTLNEVVSNLSLV